MKFALSLPRPSARAIQTQNPKTRRLVLDQRVFLRASYVVGKDIDRVWRPTGLVIADINDEPPPPPPHMPESKGGEEPPLPASRPAPPGAAVGQGIGDGLGPQGSLPAPGPRRPPRPHLRKKSRFLDENPTLLPNRSVTNRRVNQVLAQRSQEPPSYRPWWALQLEVADWVSFGRLQLRRPSQRASGR
jgi:hypothetical protein